jgi:hypothetical protein
VPPLFRAVPKTSRALPAEIAGGWKTQRIEISDDAARGGLRGPGRPVHYFFGTGCRRQDIKLLSRFAAFFRAGTKAYRHQKVCTGGAHTLNNCNPFQPAPRAGARHFTFE